MESINTLGQERVQENISIRRVAVTGELVAYLALLALALVLRLAELDTVPLSDLEARQALAAWRAAWPNTAVGTTIIPDSPLLFALHSLSFSTLGGNEFTARVWTVLAGVALALSPMLFRDLMGRTRALVFSAILVCSPVLLLASRFDRPVVWTALGAVLGLWGLWRYTTQGQTRYALLTTVGLISALLLTDPTGPVMVLMLLGAAVFALWLTQRELPERDIIGSMGARLRGWPWQMGLLLGVLVGLVVGTLFMLQPDGLNSVGGLLGSGLRGIVEPRPNAPPFFPVWITLFYEPGLVLFGVGGGIWLLRRGTASAIEYFLLGWFLFGLIASLVYAGAGPEQALWLILPLAGLTTSVIVTLVDQKPLVVWNAPTWAKWLLALALIALLFVFSVHIRGLSRSFLTATEGTLQLSQVDSISAVWVLITPLFMIISFFLAGSVWGMTTAAQGAAAGFLIFSLITALGGGWNAAVPAADNPVEPWHPQTSSSDTARLRDTLTELSRRHSGGFPLITITALAPEDGIVAWLLRDYPNTRFITDLGDAQTQEIALLPELAEPPNLGASYVGQRFAITNGWSWWNLRLTDIPAWWTQRRTRISGSPSNVMVLWLRQDIYDGVQPETPVN